MNGVFVNALLVILTFDYVSEASDKYYFSTFGTLVKISNFSYAWF
jgi:hypothetical protein